MSAQDGESIRMHVLATRTSLNRGPAQLHLIRKKKYSALLLTPFADLDTFFSRTRFLQFWSLYLLLSLFVLEKCEGWLLLSAQEFIVKRASPLDLQLNPLLRPFQSTDTIITLLFDTNSCLLQCTVTIISAGSFQPFPGQ